MLHYGKWLLWTFFTALNFYDIFNQYCSNLLEKKTTVRGLRADTQIRAKIDIVSKTSSETYVNPYF